MALNINNDSIIYMVCPPNVKTGGTELAHQLVEILNNTGKISYICYATDNRNVQICDAFKKYVSDCLILSDVEDNENNIIIIPEACTYVARRYSKLQKCIWWMSVDNYLKNVSTVFAYKNYGLTQVCKVVVKKMLRIKKQLEIPEIKKTVNNHFVQSQYAKEYLHTYGIESVFLSDYINDFFYHINPDDLNKEDIIVYNPAKGFQITQAIIERMPNHNWVPLQNMTNTQVRETLLKAKVYIDFGNFPGKDRIPREAALSYCCVITGKKGASFFYEDVPLLDVYKFENPLDNLPQIVERIEDCIKNYKIKINDFEEYRSIILNEKSIFEKEINAIFGVSN